MTNDDTSPAPVFISYAREDSEFVRGLVRDLEAHGVRSWLDRKIAPGVRWDDAIQAAMDEARTVLVVLSPHSVASQAVADEVSYALEQGHLVIPVLQSSCKVPLRMHRLQHIDLTSDYAEGLRLLLDRLAPIRGSARPLALSTHPKPPGKRRPIAAGIVGACLLGLFIVVKSWPRPLAHGGAAQAAIEVADSARPAAQPSDTFGERLLEQYRTVVDSRSQWFANKQAWLSAAESFEALESSAHTPVQRAHARSAAAFSRGVFQLLEGKLAPAEEQLRAAIEADTSWAPPHIELADLLARLGKFDEAHEQSRRALRLEPDFWLGVTVNGGIYAAEGKLNEAITGYEEAARRFDVPLVKGALALAYHAAGQHDQKAKELAKTALARDPQLSSALTVLAEQALEARNPTEALTYTQRMVDASVFNVTAWLLHGDALLGSGRRADAQAAYASAVEQYSQTRQLGAPPARLLEVQAALGRGELPSERFPNEGSRKDRAYPAVVAAKPPAPGDRAYPPAAPKRAPCGCASGDLQCAMHCAANDSMLRPAF